MHLIVYTTLAVFALVTGMAGTTTVKAQADDIALRQAGQRHFIRCVACHSVSAAAPAKTGPHLQDIVGRRVASVPGFRYTTALKDQSFVWTKDRLENLLRQPQKQAPGLCLPFTGLTRRKDRTDLVAYLARPVP
ncbi:c-type cytochrome [Sphingobium sp. AS12]|uniref:c-type cytochrome n=1 Tax=Sphingobium sp. AS12 TaxID=2849495 RepID=UPI001C31CC70|nr:c-type cytochrome [Sphingobium sp. AS12]MBV2149121.1 c-type cytochrome [Sphingobium sp. AS12]